MGTNTARSTYRKLIAKHRGNLSAMAASLHITRQAMAARIERAGLLASAAAARAAAGVPGTRARLSAKVHDRARDDLVRALVLGGSDKAARDRLGLSRRTFYRQKAAYGITRDLIERERNKRDRV